MQQEKVDFNEWFELVKKSYSSPPVNYNGKSLPAFPSDTVQSNTTGQSGHATLSEAFNFYKDCVNTLEEFRSPINSTSKVLDFGVGWGRIARFFLRDIPLENLSGIDVTPEFSKICRDTFESQNFSTCGAYPPTTLAANHYDLIVGYSVFSHLSEEACLAWMKEFNRILVPGRIVAITTRGRPFFDYCESHKPKRIIAKLIALIKRPRGYTAALGRIFKDFDKARASYDRGEFVHSCIKGVDGGGSLNASFYGETFIPESYAKNAYRPFFELQKFMYDPSYQSHPIMFFCKPE